jgi:hypothetical protein
MMHDIHDYAATHSFHELPHELQQLVLSDLGSEEAYTALRMYVLAAREQHTIDRDALTLPLGPLRAAQRRAGRRTVIGRLTSVLHVRVPLWAATLAPVCLGFVIVLSSDDPSGDVVIRTIRDTIRVELAQPAPAPAPADTFSGTERPRHTVPTRRQSAPPPSDAPSWVPERIASTDPYTVLHLTRHSGGYDSAVSLFFRPTP